LTLVITDNFDKINVVKYIILQINITTEPSNRTTLGG
jgi:hypothetical protein